MFNFFLFQLVLKHIFHFLVKRQNSKYLRAWALVSDCDMGSDSYLFSNLVSWLVVLSSLKV